MQPDEPGAVTPPGSPAGTPDESAQRAADRLLAEALEAITAAYGVPPRVREDWALAWGGDDLNDGIGFVEIYDDEEDAREHLEYYGDSRVVRRTVIALRWEAGRG
jgi:hypothetical protein